MHGGPPIEYAWQVTTSRATYLEVIKDVHKVFVVPKGVRERENERPLQGLRYKEKTVH